MRFAIIAAIIGIVLMSMNTLSEMAINNPMIAVKSIGLAGIIGIVAYLVYHIRLAVNKK